MKNELYLVGAVSVGLALAQAATAAGTTASLRSGNVAMGINQTGEQNIADVYNLNPRGDFLGIASTRVGDATSPGCLCEGWGVSAGSVAAGANQSVGGVFNLTVDSFVTDDIGSGPGTFANSSVHMTSLPGLKVTQNYAAAGSGAAGRLFQDTVTIKNDTGVAQNNVRYVRVMDWDVPPTEFNELVTVKGVGTTTLLEKSHDNGFASPNPLNPGDSGAFNGGAPIIASSEDADFTDLGPTDHGAYFRFNFGTLADGESKTFSVFYGAADNEADALASLGAVGIELFSLGQNNFSTHNDDATFMWGFKGVGGRPVLPSGVPDAGSTLGMLTTAMGVLIGVARRNRKQG